MVGVAWWGAQLVRGPTERLHRGRRNGKTASLNPCALGAVARQEGARQGGQSPRGAPAAGPGGDGESRHPGRELGRRKAGPVGLHQAPPVATGIVNAATRPGGLSQ